MGRREGAALHTRTRESTAHTGQRRRQHAAGGGGRRLVGEMATISEERKMQRPVGEEQVAEGDGDDHR